MVKSKRYKAKRNSVQISKKSNGKLTIAWDGVNERQWDAWMERISPFPIEQTWSYGQAFAGVTPYQPVHGVIYDKKLPVAIVQAVEWRIFKFLRIAKIVRGPLFFEKVTDDQKNNVLELIYQRYSFWNFDLLLWTPESSLCDPILKTFDKMRMRKVVTGYSSVLLDLCQTEETLLSQMDGKWRNQLKKSEKQGLQIKLTHQGDTLDWLLTRHE